MFLSGATFVRSQSHQGKLDIITRVVLNVDVRTYYVVIISAVQRLPLPRQP